MILIISTCKEKLSELEFVKPIESIVKKEKIEFKTKHYSKINEKEVEKYEKIIMCGTALKDFQYLEDMEKFDWLKTTKKPVLGICSGAQIIGIINENKLTDNIKIGPYEVETEEKKFKAYFLNTKAVKAEKNLEILGKVEGVECIIKTKGKEIYGYLFHPEVMNQEIIKEFCIK